MARLTHRETLLPLLSGTLTALAMPGIGLVPLIAVSLVPLMAVLQRRRGFLPGFLFGIALLAIDLRWVIRLVRFYPVAIAGYAALVLCFSLGYGVLGATVTWRQRDALWTWMVLAPCLFILLEFTRSLGPLGFGFSTLFSTLHTVPWLIQSASIFGPWFLTGILVAINGGLFLAISHRRPRLALISCGLILILAAFEWVPFGHDEQESVQVAVVSSTVDQRVKLDARNLSRLTERYLDLGRKAASLDPDLIVFPESILPAYVLRDRDLTDAFSMLAREGRTQILVGTGDIRGRQLYNSVALFSPSGEIIGTYQMVRPVPFGEVIPGRALLERLGLAPWLRSFLPMDLTRGTAVAPVEGWGTPICYEITFPFLSRKMVLSEAEALITVANDAWFDGSSALEAHFASAVFRAVETRRWVIQSANGGISGIVRPDGRIVISSREEGVLSGTIERSSSRSFYTRWGDASVIGATVLLVVISMLVRALSRRQERGGRRRMPAP
jgi:apolipoprotein N-acyltransferase